MAFTDRGRTYLLIALLSLAFSFLLVVDGNFPYLGFSISLIVFAIFTYKHLKKTNKSRLYFILSVIFSAFLAIRSEPLVTLFNFSASIFFGVLMLSNLEKKSLSFLDYIAAPINLAVNSLLTKSKYYPEMKKNGKTKKSVNAIELTFGILMSVFVLVIILPLLSSTNPIFADTVRNILELFNLQKLIDSLGYQTIYLWGFRMVFFFGFLFIIPRVYTVIEGKAKYSLHEVFSVNNLPLFIPKLVTAAVLILFFITQLQLYFADETTLRTLDLSHSQRAREVFGQLCVVAGIVIALVYNSQIKTKFSNYLNWFLGLQGMFLILMAYKSDLEYINAYGFTYIRLYGFTLATLITGIFIFFYKDYLKGVKGKLPGQVTLLSATLLIIVNLVNFDYLIYHFNQARTGEGTDYEFLSTLSADSLSYRQQYLILEENTKNYFESGQKYDNDNPMILIHKIERLQDKYEKLDLRTFNLLEYIEYRSVKDLPLSGLKMYYEDLQRNRLGYHSRTRTSL